MLHAILAQLSALLRWLFLMAGFVLLGIAILIGLSWVFHWMLQGYASHPWVSVGTVMLATFILGVLIRQAIQLELIHMGDLASAIVGLCVFAIIIWRDLDEFAWISPYMPQSLPYDIEPFLPALPMIGLFGIVLSKFVSPFDNS